MPQARWQTLEEQVRGIASLVFRGTCKAGQISGTNFDGVVELDDHQIVVLEITRQFDVDKVRQGVGRIASARLAKAANGIVLRGYIVLHREPTPAMIKVAEDNRVVVLSVSQLAAMFFEFSRYRSARETFAFGSSIDPITGAIDQTDYVPVSYTEVSTGRDLDVAAVAEALLSGKNVVLLGEYGSGKSRCIRQIFQTLADDWDTNFRFPFAVNLRDCWGLGRADEIIRRGVTVFGLDEIQASAVRALHQQSLIVLLDGFDELGSQAWSLDESRLRQLRSRALAGVRDVISISGMGTLIAGREHYFSSNEEMFTALGVSVANTLLLRAKDEFTEEQLELYFDRANLAIELPSWLPRRPLICQTIALLSDTELNDMFGIESHEASFWNHFIKVVCERDARINTFFDADVIYQVFVALSRITRKRPANMGPISQRDLQEAFEQVVGQLPVEEASVMLLRLPSLGRIGPDSSDRQFVDMFILDGLRAKDIVSIAESSGDSRKAALNDSWFNPLGSLGHSVLSKDMENRVDTFVQLAQEASLARNATVACDIVAASCYVMGKNIDFKNLAVQGGSFSDLNLQYLNVSNVTISDATIEVLSLPNSPPSGVVIINSLAEKVSGASSFAGLPQWIHLQSVDSFDSVQTVASIRRAGLSAAHEVLVAVLKKTFQQKGAGRKQEALLRGFGAGNIRKTADAVLSLLMREGILDRHKGDEGWVYTPERKHAARVGQILQELRSTKDPVWSEVDKLNK